MTRKAMRNLVHTLFALMCIGTFLAVERALWLEGDLDDGFAVLACLLIVFPFLYCCEYFLYRSVLFLVAYPGDAPLALGICVLSAVVSAGSLLWFTFCGVVGKSSVDSAVLWFALVVLFVCRIVVKMLMRDVAKDGTEMTGRQKGLAWGVILSTVTVFGLLLAMLVPALFPRADNVLDQIYLEVRRDGEDSVLLTGTPDAHINGDVFATFGSISIPELGATLSTHGASLQVHFFDITDPRTGELISNVSYRYDAKENILYGNHPPAILDAFLVYYFQWLENAGESCKFTPDAPGEYEFIRKEYP